jgi:uncharacterized protein YndB with AHSA1/START domain
MGWLKWAVGIVAGLVAVLVAGAFFLPPSHLVVRSIDIAAPPDRVFALLEEPRQWKRWTVWNRRDPAMAMTYSGPDKGRGAGWAWKSESQGDGEMTFTAVEAPRRVAYDLYFPDFGTTSSGDLVVDAAGGRSRVTWSMDVNMGSNPMFRWLALMADRMVGPDFEAGLAQLKVEAEKP